MYSLADFSLQFTHNILNLQGKLKIIFTDPGENALCKKNPQLKWNLQKNR